MSSSRVNRTPAPLTANEKWMVLNVYRYFSGATSIGKQNKNITLRKRVGLVLGVAESTVGGCVVWSETAQRWHIYTKSQPGEDITSLLRTHIMISNKTGQQLSYDNFFPNWVRTFQVPTSPNTTWSSSFFYVCNLQGYIIYSVSPKNGKETIDCCASTVRVMNKLYTSFSSLWAEVLLS